MAFSNPTAAYTAADLASMIPEIWTPVVNEPNFPKAVAANFFTDLSPYADEGDRFHVPDIYTNVFTASTQTTQGNAVVDQSPATVDVYLDVDTHKYIAWIIGDKDMKQLAKKYNLNERYARIAQNVLINALEASLFGLWSSLSTNTVGDTATVLSDAEIVQAIEKLESLNFDTQGEGAFFFHPFVYWRQIVTIAKYYTWNTSQLPVIREGNFGPMDKSRGLRGQVYGIPIFTSTNVVKGLSTYRNLLAVPAAFGFAIQSSGSATAQMPGPAKIRVQADYMLQNLGLLTVADIIYGVAVLRENGAVLVNSNDTAITS
jgi:hypothetical protein